MSNNLTTNPIKLSQPAGAALAMMGIKGSIPLWHGVQGCTAFAKVLFIQHFREPFPFQTTALSQTDVVMGGDWNLLEGVGNIAENAEFIGILTTGVAETCGSDIARLVKAAREKFPHLRIAAVYTPDFEGSLETGYANAAYAVLEQIVRPPAARRKRQVAILPGAYVTPGEVEYLREMLESFSLKPVFFPDIGDSLFGYMSKNGFSASSQGGIRIDEVERLADSAFVVSIGRSMKACASLLAKIGEMEEFHFDGLTSLLEVDAFVSLLEKKSGVSSPERQMRIRRHLQDAVMDAYFHLSGKKAAIAGDPDFINRWSAPLLDMGLEIEAVSSIPCEAGRGDLRSMEELIAKGGIDLVIGNSHAAEMAEEKGVPAVRSGLPVYDRFGEPQSVRLGYDGIARLYMECANAVLAGLHEARPYVSPLRAGLMKG